MKVCARALAADPQHLHPCEQTGQKRRISRQADERGHSRTVLGQRISTVMQPVLRNVGVEQRIASIVRIEIDEYQPQRQAQHGKCEKKPRMLADQIAHAQEYRRYAGSICASSAID